MNFFFKIRTGVVGAIDDGTDGQTERYAELGSGGTTTSCKKRISLNITNKIFKVVGTTPNIVRGTKTKRHRPRRTRWSGRRRNKFSFLVRRDKIHFDKYKFILWNICTRSEKKLTSFGHCGVLYLRTTWKNTSEVHTQARDNLTTC